ncbi:MAG TPA: amidohydrolase family protein [Vicinamibacteria bacterium]|nr:amidohydrolase family protein [Vicinamibacteria bacterium]
MSVLASFILLNGLAFTHVTVVPMDSDRVLGDQAVVVAGDRIVSMGPADRVRLPAGVRRIDGAGRYLVPGLVDAHVHIPPEASDEAAAAKEFLLFVAHGVTTARVMIGQPEHLALRAAITRGALLGPALFVASPPLGVKVGSLPGVPEIASPEDARRFALQAKQAGYDGVKLLDGMSRAEYEAFVAGAREAGLPVWGHVPDAVGLARALELKQDSIEHLAGYLEALIPDASPLKKQEVVRLADAMAALDEDLLPGLARATREAGVVSVPTLDFWRALVNAETPEELGLRPGLEYVPAQQRAEWAEQQRKARERNPRPRELVERYHALRARIVRALRDAGAPIALGTDSPDVWNVAGVAALEELRRLGEAGLTPREALHAATRGAAELLGGEKEFGSVAPGLRADLVLLEADPLADVRNLGRRAGVVVRGRWLPEPELRERLLALATEAKPSP